MITVTVKTVKQQTVKVDVEETATALDLKGKIQETLGADFPAENQKLIFKGKILQDTAIVGEVGLTETSFVVVMVTKPKTPPAPEPQAAPSAATPGPSQSAVAPSDAPAPPEGASGAPEQSTEQKIDNLMEMTGNVIPRSQVAEVLERAQNNVSVAGALLSGGIEELLPGEGELTAAPQSSVGLPGVQGVSGNPLDFLRSQPQFQQLRDILKTDASALQPILEQIKQTNPDLYELINSNRDAFMRLINDPSSGPSGPPAPSGSSGPPGPGPHQISVTSSDMQAITRLKDLGFSEHRAAEAYFACEKNEEMAANFLISDDQPDD